MFVPVITNIAKSDDITGNSNKLGIVDRAVRTIKDHDKDLRNGPI